MEKEWKKRMEAMDKGGRGTERGKGAKEEAKAWKKKIEENVESRDLGEKNETR